ncbi:MAG TPA: hypothetical protein DCQ32_07640 [Cyanobacteria bacterium UBA8156]|nr:hypothetical protein [Cyanobacteria bacterium UBA8156]
MSTNDVLTRAKQGDADAIAALIDRSLRPKGIAVSAAYQGDRLEIVVRARQHPNRRILLSLVQRGMESLAPAQVERVDLVACSNTDDSVFWRARFELGTAGSLVAVNGLGSDLGPLAATLRAQQDTIVRFVEGDGQVRCLASLSDISQALGTTNLSAVAIARHPQLRQVSECLSTFGRIDENGDRCLEGLSLLEPGKPWRTVTLRIRVDCLWDGETPHIVTLEAREVPKPEPVPPPIGEWQEPAENLLAEFGEAATRSSIVPPSPPTDEEASLTLSELADAWANF